MRNCWSVSISIAAGAKTGYRQTTVSALTPTCRRRNRLLLTLSTATVNPVPVRNDTPKFSQSGITIYKPPSRTFPC